MPLNFVREVDGYKEIGGETGHVSNSIDYHNFLGFSKG